MTLLDKKDRMKAITTANKICRLNEDSLNEKYKSMCKDLKNRNTDKKRKEWLAIVVGRIEAHLDKCDEAFANQTIPDYGD